MKILILIVLYNGHLFSSFFLPNFSRLILDQSHIEYYQVIHVLQVVLAVVRQEILLQGLLLHEIMLLIRCFVLS
jgi:hypothetical protein